MKAYDFKEYPEVEPEVCGWYLVWDGDIFPRMLDWDGERWVDEQGRHVDTVSHWDFMPERPHGA